MEIGDVFGKLRLCKQQEFKTRYARRSHLSPPLLLAPARCGP